MPPPSRPDLVVRDAGVSRGLDAVPRGVVDLVADADAPLAVQVDVRTVPTPETGGKQSIPTGWPLLILREDGLDDSTLNDNLTSDIPVQTRYRSNREVQQVR